MRVHEAILALTAALAAGGTAQAEDWATTDGQAYHDVKVMSHDDAYVTILDSDGGARVLLRTLGPDLQKRFAYDAAKAAACEAATVAADKHDHETLVAQQAAAQQAAAVQPQAAPAPAVIVRGPAAPAAKPTVDVAANSEKIDEDKKALEDTEIDIRDATRDAGTWNYHWDQSGEIRSNTIGESAEDRLDKLKKKKKALEDEIRDLEAQNAAAGQPAQ